MQKSVFFSKKSFFQASKRAITRSLATFSQQNRNRPIKYPTMATPTVARYTSEARLTIDTLNHPIKQAEYAVRGALVIRAEELAVQLRNDPESLPFDEVIFCNIGNPQQLKQPPVSFFRQVLSLCVSPSLANGSNLPTDVIERASSLLKALGSTGAYSHSKGAPAIRHNIANFIHERDGYYADPESIFITDGASPAVQSILQLLIRSASDGIMIPIPQYPLYTASIALLGGTAIPYYLDEDHHWSLNVTELERSWHHAQAKGILPRAIAIINPGNPTGQVFEEKTVRDVIEWANSKDMMILADEVYQQNVYHPEKSFYSFKKGLFDLGPKFSSSQQLVSFHSVSKGVVGECGKRGGYLEAINIENDVLDQLYKLRSVSLCSNVSGQIMVDLMVKPPKPGEPSYELYHKETSEIFNSLKHRAELLATTLNNLTGVSCQTPEGAMYIFPRIRPPQHKIDEAEATGKPVDFLYAMDLLNATGICVVPGSGFGQVEGTYHFRTTFLPREESVEKVARLMTEFHEKWMQS